MSKETEKKAEDKPAGHKADAAQQLETAKTWLRHAPNCGHPTSQCSCGLATFLDSLSPAKPD